MDCWGHNGSGQLGNGTITDSDVPVAVHGIGTAATLSSGWNSFCARLSTGHLDCWGNNGYGQLGNGPMTDSNAPVAVTGISTAATLTYGNDSLCALLSTSQMDCWGTTPPASSGTALRQTPMFR